MAVNIFERYGIKEVANVYFQALNDDEKSMGINEGDIVLYLDTLKVSTVETSAESVSAQGGWGNPKLVTWDYGKEITVTLEDAVISWEEMRILLGAESYTKSDDVHKVYIHKNAEKKFYNDGSDFEMPVADGETVKGKNHFPTEAIKEKVADTFKWINMSNGHRGQGAESLAMESFPSDAKADATMRIRFFWDEEVTEDDVAQELVISPERFPGTYRVVGDALIRSEKDGSDQAFQFVIKKAKLLSSVTLTMQAEGDPATFEMSLDVLRDEDGEMMSLIKY